MKVLSPSSILQLEQETMHRQQLPAIRLMERAARAVFHEIQKISGECRRSFVVLCGFGNNGGDGLALSALLHQAGHHVYPYLLQHDGYTAENLAQQEKLCNLNIPIEPLDMAHPPAFPDDVFIIDALFGHGLSRPLSDPWRPLIQYINTCGQPVFAIDIPSGLPADAPITTDAAVVRATHTYTFTCPKLTLLLPDFADYTGTFHVLDIGLDQEFHASLRSPYFYTCKSDITRLVRRPAKFAHKGTFGHAWIGGGRHGSIGSIVLACRAALKTGCGLVTAYVPACGYNIVQTAFPEALATVDSQADLLQAFPNDLSLYNACAVGMGMGTHPKSQIALFQLLQSISKVERPPRFVFDADAINILSLHPDWHALLPAHSVLTPHPKELQRLLGHWENDLEKIEMAQTWSARYNQLLVIKGAHTAIVFPDGNVHFNSSGNPGMATAGSGDVLSGILASLLAQGYDPREAALIGVYLHGLAGDCAALAIHKKSIVAGDIIAHISEAWHHILPQNTDWL